MQPNTARASRFISILWAVTTILTTALALLLASTVIISYPTLRSLGDTLAADGSLERFTPELYTRLRPLLAVASLLMAACTAASFRFRQPLLRFIADIPSSLRQYGSALPADFKHSSLSFWHLLWRPNTWIPVLTLTVTSFLTKIWFISIPFQHDEAYTFSVFAVKPLAIGLSDYHFPNNHLFHTFLVHLSYQVFGAHDWSVRLPAMAAGVLLAPLVFLLARRWYGQVCGLLSGALAATLPVFILYSTNARGYTLVTLFTLLLFGLGSTLLEHNNRFKWLLAILFTALGFYTVPIFLFPFGIWLTWMGLTWLARKHNPAYAHWNLFLNLVVAVLAAATLAILLYLPVFKTSGIQAVFGNQWVTPLSSAEFWPTLRIRAVEIWTEWNTGLPLAAGIAFAIGFLFSFFTPIRQTHLRPQIGLIFIPIIFAIQRPNPWAKTWFFLTPLIVIWAVAGWVYLVKWVAKTIRPKWNIGPLLTALLLMAIAAGSLQYTLKQSPSIHPTPGPIEQSVQVIAQRLKADQIIVITAPDEAPLWYYLYKYHLPQDTLRRNIPFKQAYVVVNTQQGQSIESVITERGPDLVFFNRDSAQKIFSAEDIIVYQVDSNLSILQREYPQWQP